MKVKKYGSNTWEDENGQIWRRCYFGGEEKPIEEFSTNKAALFGKEYICKEHKRIQEYQYAVANPHRIWARKTISDHKTNYKPTIINIERQILIAYAKTVTHCLFCGVELQWGPEQKNGRCQPDSPTLDRIDSSQREINHLSEIQIICHRCNTAKSEMSNEEYVNHCKLVSARRAQILGTTLDMVVEMRDNG